MKKVNSKLFIFLLFLSLLVLTLRPIEDPDFWWHLKLGEKIASSGELNPPDGFSYTHEGKPQFSAEWLANLVMYLSFRTGGFHGVNLLKIVVLALTFAFLLLTLKHAWKEEEAGFYASVLAVVLVLFSLRFRLFIRPYLFSFLFFSIYLFLVSSYEKNRLLMDTGEWLKMNALNFPMSLSSLFSIHWFILILCLIMFFKKDRVFYSLALGFLLVNYGFTFFTLDTTRIFSLLSWGVLFECMFHSYKLAGAETSEGTEVKKQFLQSLVLIGIVSFIVPRYFSWAGEIHTTSFYQFLRKVFR